MQRRPADTEEEKAEEVSTTSAHSLCHQGREVWGKPGKWGLCPGKINRHIAHIVEIKQRLLHLNAGEEPLLAFALQLRSDLGWVLLPNSESERKITSKSF